MNLDILKTINKTNVFNLKIPLNTMDNNEWQNIFNVLKLNVTCIKTDKIKYLNRECIGSVIGKSWSLSGRDTADTSQDGYYCNYINDILRNIRSGEHDYCYRIYQVIELLKFEPSLKTKLIHRYDMDYIEVWV